MMVPDLTDLRRQQRRLAAMLAVNLVCVLLAAGAAVGVFAYHVMALVYLFAAAILAGFAAHLWLMLGLARRARPKGSA